MSAIQATYKKQSLDRNTTARSSEKTINHVQYCSRCRCETIFSTTTYGGTFQVDTCQGCGAETSVDFDRLRKWAEKITKVSGSEKH